jgi:hypothetical protein
MNPDLDATMLRGIARSLIETTKNCKYINRIQTQRLEQQIIDLQARLDNPPTATNAKAPEGYEENWGQVPNFTIPAGEGFFRPAKYIKQLADGWVAGLGDDCGPDNRPWIASIYAKPDYSSHEPPAPLPPWLHNALIRPSLAYHTFREAVAELSDWGILADIE